jgi:hypothetical protein
MANLPKPNKYNSNNTKTIMKIKPINSALLAVSLGCSRPLTVLAQPVITNPPASQTVLAGANVTFTVAASGTGPFTYQ